MSPESAIPIYSLLNYGACYSELVYRENIRREQRRRLVNVCLCVGDMESSHHLLVFIVAQMTAAVSGACTCSGTHSACMQLIYRCATFHRLLISRLDRIPAHQYQRILVRRAVRKMTERRCRLFISTPSMLRVS